MSKNYQNLIKNGVESGEYGFCERCGDVRKVVVQPSDRLQNRLRKAYSALAAKEKKGVSEKVEEDLSMALWEIQNHGIDVNTPKASRAVLIKMMTCLVVYEGLINASQEDDIDLVRAATEFMEGKLDDWSIHGK